MISLISKRRESLAIVLILSFLVNFSAGQAQEDAPSPIVIPSSARPELNTIEGSSIYNPQRTQQPQQPGQTQQQLPLDNSQQQQQQQQRIQWPMVNVDGQGNKSKVDVHVPIFFDMTNQNDKETGNSKLDLSVMQGLVTVNSDKARDHNGQLIGPVKVTVFGIPVYTGKGVQPSAQLVASNRQLADNIAQANSNMAKRGSDLVSQIAETTQRNNEKLMRSLSDMFERFSMALRQTSGSANNISQQQPQQQQQLKQ